VRRLLLGLAASSLLLLAEEPPQALKVRTTVSAETLRLPQNEALGLTGFSTTAAFGPLYLGPGFYGAARGQRGGFFTFGLEGGLRGQPFPAIPLEWDAGLFVGGGGGAAAPQGGGLMVRPHLGVTLLLGRVQVGAALSRVRFPNGGIDSTQAALTVAFSSDHLWVPEGGWGPAFEGPVNWAGRRFELEALRLDPAASSHTRRGAPQPSLDLAGVGFVSELGGPLFRFVAADAAVRGSSSGYMQALAGLGLRAPLAGPLGLEGRLGAGLGGGGDLDTGGGFLLSGEGALTFGTGGWRGAVALGFLRAPGGSFRTRTVTLRLAHCTSTPAPWGQGQALAEFDRADWRVGAGSLVYRHALRQDGSAGPIQLLTLRADRRLNDTLYLTGEAGSATGGGAGGYSTGLAGLGGQTPAWARQRLFLEAALGAGGGGGLRSGGGLLASLRTGWRLELPQGLGLDATVGKVRAPHGDLATTTFGLGLHLRFAALER
jgi:hypothetical protein